MAEESVQVYLKLTPAQRRVLQGQAKNAAMPLGEFLLARLGLTAGICRVCGCTDESGCRDRCHWADTAQTLCSQCQRHLAGDPPRDQWDMLGLIVCKGTAKS